MTTKHTPGPWHIDGGTNSKNDLFIWKVGEYYGGHAIATVHGEIQEDEAANARLIAAAPDLLKACKQALRETFKPGTDPLIKQLKAVITKATENNSAG